MGFFDKIKQGLTKTKTKMDAQLTGIFAAYEPGDEEFFEDLEETLILADTGVETTTKAIAQLRKAIELKKLRTGAEVKKEFVQILTRILKVQDTMLLLTTQPSVVLVVGVNGVGKTTTIGKLAAQLKKEGNRVLLSAADTFRAAAADQLTVWAQRAGVDIVKHEEGSDPAAVVFDSIQAAKARGTDVVIIDTAGRLHNKSNLFFELYVSERVSQLITQGRKIVVILGRSEFHGFKIHLGRCTANDKSNMVRRTSCRPESFHFLHQKIHQFIGRNQRLCLLIKICLIGRPASLSNKKELILHTVDSVKIDLCRQIATRIHLTVHIEGCILRVTEIFLGIGLIYAQRKCLFITSAGPYLLTFLTHDDGCSCILTERKLTLASYFGIPQHGKGYILVVIARLRVVQYAGDHLIMLATQ